jgi:hypothetical protein
LNFTVISRLSVKRAAVAPIVAEVILVAICVILSVVVLLASGAIAPSSSATPRVAIIDTDNDANEMRFTLSECSPISKFISFKLVLTPPGSAGNLEATFDGSYTFFLNETLTLSILDLGGDGYVSRGDYLVLTSSTAYESGTWNFFLIFLESGGVVTSTSLVV